MAARRITLAVFAALSVISSGCQSTTSGGGGIREFVAGIFARKPTDMAMTTPAAQPMPAQAKVYLNPGTEVQWQVRTAQDQPGQVSSGRGMIGPDGTVVVGPYGACKLAGLTLDQATLAMENHLAAYMQTPSVQLSATIAGSTNDLSWRSARVEPTSEPVVRSAFQK